MIPAAQTSRAARHWRAGQKAAQGKQWAGAAREFERALQFAPNDPGAWHGLAVSQSKLARLHDATVAARRAFDLAPDSAPACMTLADCLTRQNRHAEACDVYADLPAATERSHDFLLAHATALFNAQRPAEAVQVFLAALSLNMANPLAHFRMGLAFRDLRREHDANLCFQTALATDKTGALAPLILSQLVYGARLSCEWDHLQAHTDALLTALDVADDSIGAQISPFTLLSIEATREQQLRVGRLATQSLTRHMQPLPPPGPRQPGRIRIGYLSADFCNHATALLMTELLECRDTARFETFLYSHSVEDGTAIQRRVRAAGDHCLDVGALSDADVARRMRADGIDIVVDLKGHTRDSRFQLLAYRPAPVQTTFLGFPGTCGAPFIDYVIGDRIVTPFDHAADYTEKIAQMPVCYQPNDRHRALPKAVTRAEEGLPEGAVVLCCFNQTYKISPRMLDLWARILQGAPNTVLWMLTWTAHGHVNLSKELAARGVDLDRVLFAPKVSVARHIARLRCADLFLDTWPYNAHTTASEALWCGVPVLTVPGPTFASRVAASLVAACGLPDLACAGEDEYVDAAIRLAHEPAQLQALKDHLDSQRLTLPLFDTARYTRDYEALLLRMFERQQAGLAPDHLPAVESLVAEAVAEVPAISSVAGDAVIAMPDSPDSPDSPDAPEVPEVPEASASPVDASPADAVAEELPQAPPAGLAERIEILENFGLMTQDAVNGLLDAVAELRQRPAPEAAPASVPALLPHAAPAAHPDTEALKALQARFVALEQQQSMERQCRDLTHVSRIHPKSRTVVFVGNTFFGCNIKYAWLAFRAAARREGVTAWFLPHDARQAQLVGETGERCFPLQHADWTEEHLHAALSAAVVVLCNHFLTTNPFASALLAGARPVQLWHGVSIKEIGLRNLAPLKQKWPHAERVLATCGPFARLVGTAAAAEPEWRRWFAFDRYDAAGYARNDVMFREPDAGDLLNVDLAVLEQARAAMAQGRRVILYAPTWRDVNRGAWVVEAGLERIARELAQRGDLLIVNLHPVEQALIPQLRRALPTAQFVAPHTDIYPLLAQTSMLITDYSSLMFDYLLLDKPIVLFRPDHAHYVTHSRQLFEDKLAERPGPLASDARELLALLRGADTSRGKHGSDPLFAPTHAQARQTLRAALFDQPDGQAGERLNAVVLEELDLALRPSRQGSAGRTESGNEASNEAGTERRGPWTD